MLMSESIIIALIGIVPSVLIAIVTVISNNEIIKKRLDYLESVASEYHHYEEKLQILKQNIMNCEDRCFELREQVDELKHRRNSKGRTHI